MLRSADNLAEALLLQRLQAGDQAAFDELYGRFQPRIYRYVLRMAGSPEAAEDVVQEVFMGLLKAARGFDPAIGSLGSYLYGIARNLLLRQRGGGFEEELEDVPASAGDPLDGLEQSEQLERLRAAVGALPAHYREVVVLCEMEEMDYAEVAEILGCAVGTVRSRLNRARGLLLERLARERCRA